MDPRRRGLLTLGTVVAAAALGASVLGGGPVERPAPPGGELAGQLDALRGANDLVRATRADVGHDPALYPTAYGRLEAGLAVRHRGAKGQEQQQGQGGVPELRAAPLAELARTDSLDTPAWRAHYVCLSLSGAEPGESRGAATVLERAGLRKRAVQEARGYLRAPDEEDDALTSLATRAAFLQTLTCLGQDADVSRATTNALAADAAGAERAVPALYAVEALRGVGVRARAARALRGADTRLAAGCTGLDPIQRAALTLLRHRLTRQTYDCLLPYLADSDTQTRWLVRRALTLGDDGAGSPAGSLPEPVGRVRPDGLVAKSPAQLGTLTATYNAARALTAAAQQEHTPYWLERRLTRMGSGTGASLDPSDRLLLAMTCHRLALSCGPQAEKGAAEAARLKLPARLTTENERRWYGVMSARAEFGLACGRTAVELPDGEAEAEGGDARLSARSLRIVAVLAHAGCTASAARLTEGADLVAQTRKSLREGDLVTASDAVQAALASDQSIPQDLWDDLPGLLRRHRDKEFPDLYAASPGGSASAEATRAAYYLLA
ncbi:hypothetical protein [Streptomyces sp. SP18BB07]|uniref:hypothetical protein n=1 Tax=Streptomyces sp. SP18BB07 TaxID=3002522 RepID=UPI002E770591|nr:hypothetical protein [Streptomyces sp. SP18BB07]MEE1762893.1 hypothetical protein [Streptomyces sp. SP18BB07]